MAASYRKAIRWIAYEDEPTYTRPEEIEVESGMTVALVADLFGKATDAVAADVSRLRIRIEADTA